MGQSVVLGSRTSLSGSATPWGGSRPGCTITFYLLAPGVTASTPISSGVYSYAMPMSGNGTYTSASGADPGGFVPATTGTYN